MGVWKGLTGRWSKKELDGWSSMRKTAYLLLPLLIYLAAHDLLQILLLAVTELFLQKGGSVAEFIRRYAATVQGVINGLSILGGVAVIGKAVSQEIAGAWREKKEEAGRNAIDYLMLGTAAFCFSVGLNIVFYQTGFSGSSQSYEAVYEIQYGVRFAVGLILYGLVSPFAEEAVFRGLLFQRMKRCFGYQIALFFSSLLFGLYHGNMVQAVYGTILGIAIALCYEKFGSFAAPMLFHSVANISVYTLTYGNGLAQGSRQTALTIAIILLSVGIVLHFRLYRKQDAG